MPFYSGGGGGSTSPAGSNTQVQYNNSGAFGASPDLVWDGAVGLTVSDTIVLGSSPNGAAEVLVTGAGAQLSVLAAAGDASHVGGELILKSGASDGNDGGDLTIEAGRDASDGSGGNVTISSGGSVDGDGGEINIQANGSTPVGGAGGQVHISAGNGATGGDLLLEAGGPDGSVQVYAGDGYIQFDNSGLQIGATKLGFYQNAAVVQPVVPLTLPTTQNVITALVALGLIAQHD